MTDLLAEVDELLARVLEQPEQLVDGGEEGRAGVTRSRTHPPRSIPRAARPPDPEQCIEREVPCTARVRVCHGGDGQNRSGIRGRKTGSSRGAYIP